MKDFNSQTAIMMDRARQAVLARDYQLAARMYKNLLQNDPENIVLLKNLGDLYERSGNDSASIPVYNEIVRLDPKNLDALNSLGAIYRRLKRYADSIDVLSKAVILDENNTQVFYNLGFTYKLMGKYNDAITCFERVIENNPNDVLAYNHLGTIYALENKNDQAIASYQRGLKIDPNHPIIHLNLAKSYENLENYEQAICEYENALRYKPGWLDAIDGYAELLLYRSKTQQAQELIKQALSLNPQNVDLHNKMGKVFREQSNFEAAEEEYNSVLEKSSDNKNALSGLADTYEASGKKVQAVHTMERLDSLYPDEDDVLKQFSHILMSANKLNEAGQKIKAVWDKNPDDVQTLNLLGQWYICRGEDAKAFGCFKKIDALNPKYKEYLKDVSERYFQKNDLDKAIEYNDKYLNLKSDNSRALYNRARYLEKKEDYKGSLDCYKKLEKIDSANLAYKKGLDRSRVKLGLVDDDGQDEAEKSIYENILVDDNIAPDFGDDEAKDSQVGQTVDEMDFEVEEKEPSLEEQIIASQDDKQAVFDMDSLIEDDMNTREVFDKLDDEIKADELTEDDSSGLESLVPKDPIDEANDFFENNPFSSSGKNPYAGPEDEMENAFSIEELSPGHDQDQVMELTDGTKAPDTIKDDFESGLSDGRSVAGEKGFSDGRSASDGRNDVVGERDFSDGRSSGDGSDAGATVSERDFSDGRNDVAGERDFSGGRSSGDGSDAGATVSERDFSDGRNDVAGERNFSGGRNNGDVSKALEGSGAAGERDFSDGRDDWAGENDFSDKSSTGDGRNDVAGERDFSNGRDDWAGENDSSDKSSTGDGRNDVAGENDFSDGRDAGDSRNALEESSPLFEKDFSDQESLPQEEVVAQDLVSETKDVSPEDYTATAFEEVSPAFEDVMPETEEAEPLFEDENISAKKENPLEKEHPFYDADARGGIFDSLPADNFTEENFSPVEEEPLSDAGGGNLEELTDLAFENELVHEAKAVSDIENIDPNDFDFEKDFNEGFDEKIEEEFENDFEKVESGENVEDFAKENNVSLNLQDENLQDENPEEIFENSLEQKEGDPAELSSDGYFVEEPSSFLKESFLNDDFADSPEEIELTPPDFIEDIDDLEEASFENLKSPFEDEGVKTENNKCENEEDENSFEDEVLEDQKENPPAEKGDALEEEIPTVDSLLSDAPSEPETIIPGLDALKEFVEGNDNKEFEDGEVFQKSPDESFDEPLCEDASFEQLPEIADESLSDVEGDACLEPLIEESLKEAASGPSSEETALESPAQPSNEEAEKTASLLLTLKDLADFLPEEIKEKFHSSKEYMHLEFIISKLTGNSETFLQAAEVLQDHVSEEEMSLEEKGQSEGGKVKALFEYLRGLISHLPESDFSKNLDSKLENTIENFKEMGY